MIEILYIGIIFLLMMNIILLVILKRKKHNYNILEKKYFQQNSDYEFLRREKNRDNFQNKILNEKKNKRILIGDYNIYSLKQTISIIRIFNFDIDIVTSGEDIIDKIKHNYTCDLIITNNIYKHGCDGPTMFNELKKLNKFNIPVVINTISSDQTDYFINVCGFNDYIVKPMTEESFKKIVAKFLDK